MNALGGVCLTLAYDGSGFAGWQRQPVLRSVQGVVEEAIRCIDPQAGKLRGASRTDAGVHARGQVAAFDTERRLPLHSWLMGINDHLPDDVAVMAAAACAVGYDPRHDSVDKTYRYLIYLGDISDPLWRQRAWYLGALRWRGRRTLDLEAMRQAAQMLCGEHDFRAFRASNDDRDNTVRHLHNVDVQPGHAGDAELWSVHVRGSAFLRQMVRIIVGTLVDVGRHHLPAEAIPTLLGPQARRDQAGTTAPAHGLTLMGIQLGRQVTR